jgi:hypothetical protein
MGNTPCRSEHLKIKSLISTCSESHPENSQCGHALRNSFTVSNVTRTPKTVSSINFIKFWLHAPKVELQMEQGCKVRSLLPHRRSWGSGRWMCTWIANSRQIPPATQRYIHTSVQWSDSRSSEDGVMGVSLAWVLLPIYFRASSYVVAEDGGAACSARDGTDGRDGLVAEWPGLAGVRTRAVVMPNSDGYEAFVSAVLGKGPPFCGRCGAATVI